MKTLMTFALAALISGPAFGATEGMKIGYIDMQKAIQSTKAGKDAKRKLESEFNKKKSELDKKEGELQTMAQDLEKKAMVLSDEVRGQKQRAFREEQMKFQKLVAESQLEIQKRERELTEPIVKKMRQVIEDIAKKEKYDLVLQKTDMTVLFGKDNFDLTDKVVKAFNDK